MHRPPGLQPPPPALSSGDPRARTPGAMLRAAVRASWVSTRLWSSPVFPSEALQMGDLQEGMPTVLDLPAGRNPGSALVPEHT